MKPKPQYTTGELAKLLGCSQQTVVREISRGEIDATVMPIGGFRRVSHSNLMHYLAVREQQTVDAEWNHAVRREQPFLHARRLPWVHDGRDRYTTGEVAKILTVSSRTVAKWCDNALLRSYRIPGSRDRRIRKSDLIEFALHYGWFQGDDITEHDI